MKTGVFMQIIQEEWQYLWQRNRSVFILLLLLPVIYSILFGLVYQQNVIRQLPTAVYDQDQSSASRKYTRLFEDSEKFDVTAYVDSQEEMERLLREEAVLAAIAIPPDFSRHIKQGLGSETVLIVNSANNTLSNSAITFAWEINRSFAAATGQQLFEGLNRMPGEAMNLAYPVHVSVRLLHNPLSGFSPFMLTGLSVQGVQIALLLAAGPMLVR
jgi:ABC-2 type transport system permease protein